jgi:hypothetical protein
MIESARPVNIASSSHRPVAESVWVASSAERVAFPIPGSPATTAARFLGGCLLDGDCRRRNRSVVPSEREFERLEEANSPDEKDLTATGLHPGESVPADPATCGLTSSCVILTLVGAEFECRSREER